MRKSVQYSRRAYVKKIQKEFRGQDIGFKGNWYDALKSEKKYNEFKQSVRDYRSKLKVKKDYAKIQARYEDYQQKETLRRKKSLWDMYEGDKTIVGRIYDQRQRLGLTKQDYFNKAQLQRKIFKSFKEDVTQEVSYEASQNQLDKFKKIKDEAKTKDKMMKVGAVFKNVSDEDFVIKFLDEMEELIVDDQNAIKNIELAIDHLYGNIIKILYFGSETEEAQYERGTHEADNAFWRTVTRKMKRYYKSIRVPFDED